MKIENLKVGQTINYINNGNYTGEIVEINLDADEIVVIDDASGMELLRAGIKNGSCIKIDQVKNIL